MVSAIKNLTPRNRIFIITLCICWVSLFGLNYYLVETCKKTTGCSGEYGIVFAVLGIPWWIPFQHLTSGIGVYFGVFINSVLASYMSASVCLFIKRLLGNRK